MKYLISAVFLAALSVATAQHADAKSLSRMIASTGLTPDDLNLMSEASKVLFIKRTPKSGSMRSWSNPETGSKGSVRVQGVRKNCVYLQHKTHPKGRAAVLEIRNRWCQNAKGDWLLTP